MEASLQQHTKRWIFWGPAWAVAHPPRERKSVPWYIVTPCRWEQNRSDSSLYVNTQFMLCLCSSPKKTWQVKTKKTWIWCVLTLNTTMRSASVLHRKSVRVTMIGALCFRPTKVNHLLVLRTVWALHAQTQRALQHSEPETRSKQYFEWHLNQVLEFHKPFRRKTGIVTLHTFSMPLGVRSVIIQVFIWWPLLKMCTNNLFKRAHSLTAIDCPIETRIGRAGIVYLVGVSATNSKSLFFAQQIVHLFLGIVGWEGSSCNFIFTIKIHK